MNVYLNKTFTGHYPVGTAAAVVAESEERASELLNQKLRECLLPGDTAAENMITVKTDAESVIILNDGDY